MLSWHKPPVSHQLKSANSEEWEGEPALSLYPPECLRASLTVARFLLHNPLIFHRTKSPTQRWASKEPIMSYARFALMIAVSTLVMFGLMYLNTYAFDHIEFSQTRSWMALLMGAVMAIIMMSFMWGMYPNRRVNTGIVIAAVLVFLASLWLVRSQETVGDIAYMKAMIPHHSIAIMTSERAHIRDPEVRKLADGIIDAQVREIEEMKRLIARLQKRPPPADTPDLPSYRARNASPPPPQTDASTGIDTLKMPRVSY
jgi:hypothetical protein